VCTVLVILAGKISGANHLLGRNIKTLLKVIVASIQKISNDAHP